MRLVVAFVMLSFALGTAFSAERSLVARVYTLDAAAQKCTSCGTGAIPPEAAAAIVAKRNLDFNRWIEESFSTVNEDDTGLNQAPTLGMAVALAHSLGYKDGIAFRFTGGTLTYWKESCKIFDCYKPYLSFHDTSGRKRWQKRVPFLEVPVYPFVVGDHVLYLGKGPAELALVVIDLRNGRILQQYLIPSEHGEFSLFNPLETFPAFLGGFVILQGCDVEHPQEIKAPIMYHPKEVLVLEMEGQEPAAR